jgi:polysaccharide biosynthesis transport protein
MELIRYLEVLRKWFWLIVLAVALSAGSGFIASLLAVPVYRTTTTIMVGQSINDPNPNANDFYAGEQLAQTYVQLLARESILSATINTLGLNQNWQSLRSQVAASPVSNTQLINISVLDTSPERAKAIANEIARQLILQSPTTPSPEEQARLDFIRSQLPEIESRISNEAAKVDQLDQVIAGATSARQIQDAQQRQTVIQSQISQLQSTHALLLASLQTDSVNYLSIVDPAETPTSPVSPNVPLNTLLAMAIGLSLSVGAAFLLEYLDDTIRSPEEVRQLLGAPMLAAISELTTHEYNDQLITQSEPRSPITESYRALRTNLQFLAVDTPLKTILITSSAPGEGKSVTSSNLAVVFAQAGKSVLLVDADLRRPVSHKIFGLKNRIGLTTWLVGQEVGTEPGIDPEATATGQSRRTLNNYFQPSGVPHLSVMCSGSLPPNPAELLGSNRMHDFLQEAGRTFDVVIVDSPPCVTVTDAVVLSQWVNGVLLVIDGQSTHRQSIARARENLASAGGRLLGAVVNRFDVRGSGYYGYSNYNYYYASDESGDGRPNGKGAKRAEAGKGGNILSRLFRRPVRPKDLKQE